MGPLQGIPNPLRIREELTQVVPHQVIELVRRAVTGLAARGGWSIKPPRRPPAPVVTLSTIARQGRTGRLTLAAAYQRPQQIGMDFVVARGTLLVLCQFGLDLIEIRLAHQGRDGGDERPLRLRCRLSARSGFADGMGGRASTTSRTQALSADVDVPSISGIGEQATQGGATPASPAVG